MSRRAVGLWAATLACTFVGCREDMHDQPRYEPYEASDLFSDGLASRTPVEGTVARGELHEGEEALRTGRQDGKLLREIPIPVDRALLDRGRERYDIYCSPCHDYGGNGVGLIVQRGFRPPPSFHNPRLREAHDGYFFEVITNGFGAMYSYSASVKPNDRWAIVAYIRALQLSQNATLEDVPPEARQRLEEAPR